MCIEWETFCRVMNTGVSWGFGLPFGVPKFAFTTWNTSYQKRTLVDCIFILLALFWGKIVSVVPAQMRVSVWITIHLCSKELVDVSRMVRKISRKKTWGSWTKGDKSQSHYNNINVELKVLKSCYFSSASCTSICIFRWTLKCDSKVRKMASDNSKTSGTDETPFLDSATHRYCLMALTNISWVRNTGPAPCSTESSSCRETILDRNSWDLQGQRSCTVCASVTPFT